MVCIYCGHSTQVTNSRHQSRTNQTWRRRKCSNCSNVFTTQERPELGTALMVEKNKDKGRLEPFYREKLLLSIYESCKHRPRAILESINLTDQVVNALTMQQGSITRQHLRDKVEEILAPFDKLAASIYRAYHAKEE